jgi:phosphopantetheine adenylyltransferase
LAGFLAGVLAIALAIAKTSVFLLRERKKLMGKRKKHGKTLDIRGAKRYTADVK